MVKVSLLAFLFPVCAAPIEGFRMQRAYRRLQLVFIQSTLKQLRGSLRMIFL